MPLLRGRKPLRRFPSSAVSYVSVGDFQSVSLVDGSRKIVYRQGRWPPRAALYNLQRDPAERHPRRLGGSGKRLAAILARLLEEHALGLRLTLAAKNRPLLLRLEAPGLKPSRLRSLDFSPPILEPTAGGLLVRLEEGRVAKLLVGGTPGPELDFSVELTSGDEKPLRARIDFSHPGASPAISVDSRGVRVRERPPSDGLYFDYRSPATASQDPQVGQQLGRSLRELGDIE